MRRIKPYEYLFDTHPLLRVLVFLCFGIALGEYAFEWLRPFTLHFIACTAVGAAICLVCLFVKRWDRLFFLYHAAFSAALIALGAFLMLHARNSLLPDGDAPENVYRAVVCSTPKRTKSTWQVNAIFQKGNYAGKTVRLSLLYKDTTQVRPLHLGDALLLGKPIFTLEREEKLGDFDYSAYLRRQGISGEAFCFEQNWQVGSDTLREQMQAKLSFWQRIKIKALQARSELTDRYTRHFEGPSLAFICAMRLGDKRHIDKATRRVFSETGASHILALSGLHISILFAMYCFVVGRLSRSYKMRKSLELLGVVLLWGFAFLVGMPLSLVRAVIMFSIFQMLDAFATDKLSINNLALALLIILIAAPQSLFDVGLQLSFLAVFSILIFNPLFPHTKWLAKHGAANFFYGLLTVTLCAQIGTAPLVAYYFHNLPILGILSNFIAIPLSYPILACGLLFLFLPAALQTYAAPLLDFLLLALQAALDFFGRLPLASIEVHPSLLATWLCYANIAVAIAYFHTRRFRYAVIFCALLLVIFL